MNRRGFSDEAFNNFDQEMKEAEVSVKRIAVIGFCLSVAFYVFIFALIISLVIYFANNA